MNRALLLHHDKKFIYNKQNDGCAIVEIKIWKVTKNRKYPLGVKYSLFCIEKFNDSVLVGIDNHYPKGHHLHIDNGEYPYFFKSIEDLVEDFYLMIRQKGFEI